MPRINTVPGLTGLFSITGAKDEPEYAGSVMAFAQASTPVFWTKITTYNDYTLRIVSGTPSEGGDADMSTVFASQTGFNPISGPWPAITDTHYITTAEMQPHSHPAYGSSPAVSTYYNTTPFVIGRTAYPTTTIASAGSGSGHNHPGSLDSMIISSTKNFSVKYVDVVLARY